MYCPGAVLLTPSCPGACSSPRLWVPQHITEALAFCSTDVVLLRLGPTKHGRTSKEHMPQQWPFPAASCPACSEPYVHPAPQALLEKSFIRSGAGWAQSAACSPGTPLGSASPPVCLHPVGYGSSGGGCSSTNRSGCRAAETFFAPWSQHGGKELE